MVTDTNPRWKQLGQEFQQDEEGKERGERKTFQCIKGSERAGGPRGDRGTRRGGEGTPGELGGRDFSGAGLRAETKDDWPQTGEQHEVLGEEPVNRHRALGPGRLLQTNQQDQGQFRYCLTRLSLDAIKTLVSFCVTGHSECGSCSRQNLPLSLSLGPGC